MKSTHKQVQKDLKRTESQAAKGQDKKNETGGNRETGQNSERIHRMRGNN
jgi:hypothetical protein